MLGKATKACKNTRQSARKLVVCLVDALEVITNLGSYKIVAEVRPNIPISDRKQDSDDTCFMHVVLCPPRFTPFITFSLRRCIMVLLQWRDLPTLLPEVIICNTLYSSVFFTPVCSTPWSWIYFRTKALHSRLSLFSPKQSNDSYQVFTRKCVNGRP